MYPLKHDIKTKQQMKEVLYDFLYSPLLKALNFRLEALIAKNSITIHSSHRAFKYRGKTYPSESTSYSRNIGRLAEEHHAEMDQYLLEVQELRDQEVPLVLGFISHVIDSTDNLQDYLEVLPGCVHRPITALIATCPCRTSSMSDSNVAQLTKENSLAISLIKDRLMNIVHQQNLTKSRHSLAH